ncbi:hypothetical protein [Hoeflea sp.]|uniref:hypothetical protein n=1 Tax=Hoeflea sp. TaxID=1940281 RepID=UPI003B01DB26
MNISTRPTDKVICLLAGRPCGCGYRSRGSFLILRPRRRRGFSALRLYSATLNDFVMGGRLVLPIMLASSTAFLCSSNGLNLLRKQLVKLKRSAGYTPVYRRFWLAVACRHRENFIQLEAEILTLHPCRPRGGSKQ